MMSDKTRGAVFFKKVAFVTGAVVLVIVMIWINVYSRSVRYAREGDILFNEGKLIEAIASYETAVHAYTPWNPNVRHSLKKLWEIGETLEAKHEDPAYALLAYRSLRSSIYAVRSFYTPNKEWVHRSDDKIASLVNIQRRMIENNQYDYSEIDGKHSLEY